MYYKTSCMLADTMACNRLWIVRILLGTFSYKEVHLSRRLLSLVWTGSKYNGDAGYVCIFSINTRTKVCPWPRPQATPKSQRAVFDTQHKSIQCAEMANMVKNTCFQLLWYK